MNHTEMAGREHADKQGLIQEQQRENLHRNGKKRTCKQWLTQTNTNSDKLKHKHRELVLTSWTSMAHQTHWVTCRQTNRKPVLVVVDKSRHLTVLKWSANKTPEDKSNMCTPCFCCFYYLFVFHCPNNHALRGPHRREMSEQWDQIEGDSTLLPVPNHFSVQWTVPSLITKGHHMQCPLLRTMLFAKSQFLSE